MREHRPCTAGSSRGADKLNLKKIMQGLGQSPIVNNKFLMNVLQIKINDVVYFDDDLIRITDIDDSSISRTITFDILEDCIFPFKIAWSFFVIYKNDFEKDLFDCYC